MSGKYQSYPKYKQVAEDWLPIGIPTHWITKKVQFLLKDGQEGIKIGPFGSALKLEDMVDNGYRVYGQENVIKRDFSIGKRAISKNKFTEMSVYAIRERDVLVTMMGTSGKCQLVPETAETGIIDSHLLRLRLNEREVIPELFCMLLDECHELKYQIGKQGKGSIMHGLNSSIVKNLCLPLPPLEEQRSILAFLDHETAKIDALIEKQQQLIKLLKEKRQAVISHAVTKGLNPDAPMKDSGVEWLGEVPAHWEVKRLKHISPKIGVGLVINPSHYVQDEGVHFLFGGDLSEYGFRLNKTRKMSDANSRKLYQSRLKEHDLVCVRVGYPGVTAVIPKELEGSNCASMMIIRRGDFDSQWLSYSLNSDLGKNQVERVQYGAAQKQYNIADAIEFRFPVPAKDEQIAISSYLDAQRKKFNSLILHAEQAIKLMQERRTALISAAVTGKIDVRNFKADDTNAA